VKGETIVVIPNLDFVFPTVFSNLFFISQCDNSYSLLLPHVWKQTNCMIVPGSANILCLEACGPRLWSKCFIVMKDCLSQHLPSIKTHTFGYTVVTHSSEGSHITRQYLEGSHITRQYSEGCQITRQ